MPRALKPNLRDITMCDRHNRYCGPGALSSIFGVSTGEAAEALRNSYGRRAIRGAYYHEMMAAIQEFNGLAYPFSIRYHRPNRTVGKTTLSRFIKKRDAIRNEVCLLNVGWHYVVIKGNRFCDNHTMKVVSTNGCPHRRRRFHKGWIIRHKDNPITMEEFRLFQERGLKPIEQSELELRF